MSIEDTIRENQRTIVIGVLLFVAAAESGHVRYPWEIDGSAAVITAGVATAVAGYFGAEYVESLLPDPEGIYLIAFESSDETGGSVWEISEDQFESMEIHAGNLFEWPVSKRVYEVKEYRPEENIAVANWRESVAGSQLAGDAMMPDALEQIRELREEFEPEAQRSRYLRRRLRSVARIIDRRRLEDQQEILDTTTNPTFSEDRSSVAEIVSEQIPEHLQPESMSGESTAPESDSGDDIVGFDLLDESEPITQNGENHE